MASRRQLVLEREFMRSVVELARLQGWRIHHDRPAVDRSGRWSTPIQGDPGFPDLVLARGGRVVAAELKAGPNKLTEAQQGWLAALAGGVETYVWYPKDWETIRAILSRDPSVT
jgi:hypothetical protein